MNLLGAVCYDPSTAASKATSALLAMTAFDTTNLRVTVTVPAHGKLRFRIFGGAITGATTLPTILLGFLSGATVVARVTPRDFPATMNAATQTVPIEADFTVTGLTPGSITLDLAYAVQVIVASTVIKYGGPNTNAGANAWGAMCFEVWDPQPLAISSAALAVDASGQVSANVKQVNGTAQTARDLGAQLDATISSRMATYAQPTGFLAATFPTSVASPTNITAGTLTSVGSVTGAVASVTGNVGGNVVGSVASVTSAVTLPAIPANWITAAGINAAALNGKGDWSTYAGGDTAGTTTLLGRLTATRAGLLDNLDGTISSRLAGASYTAPPTAAAIRAEIDTNSVGLAAIFSRTDVATSSRAAPGDAMTLNAAERAAVADRLLGRSIAGGADSGRLVKEALAVLRNRVAVAAGVLTVYDTDDTTPLYTAAVTTAAGDPIASIDPA